MRMSPAARTRMRDTEKVIRHYYNDMGKDKGNCTWGAGILAHRGVCSEEELARKVSDNEVNKEFDKRVGQAESNVRRGVDRTALTQDQFDALVSLTFNAGCGNARDVYVLANKGDFAGAAKLISGMTSVQINKGGKKKYVVAPGLVKRRAEESAPFQSDSDNERAEK
ncbi:glycoside hydrolase family protein [Pseudoduganella flava]|nr:glycoside hydrolase family protein [Pseudoduganella flava]